MPIEPILRLDRGEMSDRAEMRPQRGGIIQPIHALKTFRQSRRRNFSPCEGFRNRVPTPALHISPLRRLSPHRAADRASAAQPRESDDTLTCSGCAATSPDNFINWEKHHGCRDH
jgi:hypothetical protein